MIVLLLGLAVARATRLVRDDSVTEPLRDRVLGWLESPGRLAGFRAWVAESLECPFCFSGWLAGAAVVVTLITHTSVPLPVLVWLAVWWVACFAYFVLELVADADALAWGERTRRGLD